MRYYPGHTIGNYTLCQLLGRGPFTEVYLAKNRFAEKVLFTVKTPAQASIDASSILQHRYNILSRLNHTSIIPCYLLDSSEPVVRLDYAPGGSLQDSITAGDSHDLPFIIACILQIASALDYAHGQGIVHGNLKPANILFAAQGKILLSDFDVPSFPFAQSSSVLHNLPYRAPEQDAGSTLPASDQYQLACLAHDWLHNRQIHKKIPQRW